MLPSYERSDGLQRLAQLRAGLAHEAGQEQQVAVDVPVRLVGLLAPDTEDLDALNAAVPHVKLWRVGTNEGEIVMRCLVKKNIPGFNGAPSDDEAMNEALGRGTFFLAALSIAADRVLLWRQLACVPEIVTGYRIATAERVAVQLRPTVFAFAGVPMRVHAGQLCAAVELSAYFANHKWAQRFFDIYQRGEMLLCTTALGTMDFYDEAYLCFFRCLEYVCMDRVLNQRGTFDEKALGRAMLRLPLELRDAQIVPADFWREQGRKLVVQRGSSVAHLGKGYTDKRIGPQQVFELKSMVDVMCFAWLQRQVGLDETARRKGDAK